MSDTVPRFTLTPDGDVLDGYGSDAFGDGSFAWPKFEMDAEQYELALQRLNKRKEERRGR